MNKVHAVSIDGVDVDNLLEVSRCEWHMHVPLPHFRVQFRFIRESSSIVARTARREAAERAAERAALEKSRLQNDAAIQRTQLEDAVAALRRCEAAAKEESARLQAELQAARVEARCAVELRRRLNDLELDRDRHQGHS
jgi:hypothetical protein